MRPDEDLLPPRLEARAITLHLQKETAMREGPSLLLALLDTTPEKFEALSVETQKLLFAMLYDTWIRDEDVEALWLEALQSTQPRTALTQIWEKLRQTMQAAAQRLQAQ